MHLSGARAHGLVEERPPSSLARLRGQTVDVRLWTPVEEVESQALTQLSNIASLPWVAHVAAMPDVHYGKGATVGSVIAMKGAVAPGRRRGGHRLRHGRGARPA